MRISLHKIFLWLFAFLCNNHLVNAQENNSKNDTIKLPPTKYISGTLGIGGSSFGYSYDFSVSYQNKKNIFCFRYSNSRGIDWGLPGSERFPIEKIWDATFYMNRLIWNTNKFRTFGGIGASLGQGTRRGKYLYTSYTLLNNSEYYQEVDFTILGIFGNIQQVWYFNKYFGMEIMAFGQFNPQKIYYGATLGVIFSCPHQKVKK